MSTEDSPTTLLGSPTDGHVQHRGGDYDDDERVLWWMRSCLFVQSAVVPLDSIPPSLNHNHKQQQSL
jgi:hypothetical protein